MPDLILLDSNESAAKPWLHSELVAEGFSVIVRPLRGGDVWWGSPVYGRVGTENKSVDDLLGSTDQPNGNYIPRLDDELRRLQENVGLPILLTHDWARWEHFAKDTPDHRWSLEAVDNLLVGRQLRGIMLARARNTKGTHGLTQRIVRLYHYTQKPILDRLIVRPIFPYMGPMTDRAEVIYAMLSRLKGMKDKRAIAERLAASGSISEIALKEVKDLQDMGLTKTMATRLVKLVNGKEG